MRWPIGTVHLNVSDMKRSLDFYRDTIGLIPVDEHNGQVYLGVDGSDVRLLALAEQPRGQHSRGGTGLYHFAILLPSRLDLARALKHFIDRQTPLHGLSDHHVSEAIYLPDPDDNGIEIYADRPRERWPMLNNMLQMGTVYMDVEGVLSELNGQDAAWRPLPAGTIMGHMHLHVADLGQSERFYGDLLGLDMMMRLASSALFMSRDGYHHHLGLNVWRRGAPTPIAPDTLGLRWYTLDLGAEKTAALARLEAAGIPLEPRDDGVLVRDPAQNGVLLV